MISVLKNLLFSSLFILAMCATLVPINVSAQSADQAERSASACVESGGQWNSATGVCTPAREESEGEPATAQQGPCGDESFLGLPVWYKYLDTTTDETGRCSPTIDDVNDLLPIGIAVLEAVIRIGGLVAVVMIIIGSFRFITSQGNPDNAAAARKTIINSLVGLVIVIIATSVVSFIGNSLSGSGGSSTQTGNSQTNQGNED